MKYKKENKGTTINLNKLMEIVRQIRNINQKIEEKKNIIQRIVRYEPQYRKSAEYLDKSKKLSKEKERLRLAKKNFREYTGRSFADFEKFSYYNYDSVLRLEEKDLKKVVQEYLKLIRGH